MSFSKAQRPLLFTMAQGSAHSLHVPQTDGPLTHTHWAHRRPDYAAVAKISVMWDGTHFISGLESDDCMVACSAECHVHKCPDKCLGLELHCLLSLSVNSI